MRIIDDAMTRRRSLRLLPTLALLLAGSVQARPALNWAISNLPPYTIVEKGLPSDGVVDHLLVLLEREMPQYAFSYQAGSIARAIRLLDAGQPVCFTTAIRTPERERKYFATDALLLLPLQLVVRESVRAMLPLNDNGEVLLEPLLNNASLRGLVVNQRSYSPAIDELLQRRPAKATVSLRSADTGGNVLRMLAAGRGDYTFERDGVLTHYQALLGPDMGTGREALVSVPIFGITPTIGSFLCPRTPWGRERIIALDAALARLAQGREYRLALDRWLTPQTAQRYRAAQDAFYRARATPTPVEQFAPLARTP